jgi:hypothetical protein
LEFYYSAESSIQLLLSPYDWTNHFLFGSTGK